MSCNAILVLESGIYAIMRVQAGGGRADAVVLNPEQPLDGSDASLSYSFRTDSLTAAGEYTVCAEYVETRDHLTRARFRICATLKQDFAL